MFATIAAYIAIGLVYPTWWTTYMELTAKHPDALPAPWTSVACVYLATVDLFYLAARRRSAPRRLKSAYPDHH